MTLNRTLERMFRAIRCEVARNPAFAGELEAALRDYRPRRGPPRLAPPPALPARVQALPACLPAEPAPALKAPKPAKPVPALNPIAFARRAGVEGLRQELLAGTYDEAALRALLQEHNLDPAGASAEEAVPALVERLVQQAQRRLDRDQKLFVY